MFVTDTAIDTVDQLLSHRVDGRLYYAVSLQKVKLCYLVDVCTLGNWIHPDDADLSHRQLIYIQQDAEFL